MEKGNFVLLLLILILVCFNGEIGTLSGESHYNVLTSSTFISNGATLQHQDDFEAYEVGTFPSSGGWQLWYSGKGSQYQKIVNTTYASFTKSLELLGRAGDYAAVVANPITVNSEVIKWEALMEVTDIGADYLSAVAGFQQKVSGGCNWFGVVVFDSDGYIKTGTYKYGNPRLEFSTVLQSYDLNTWYKATVEYNTTSDRYSVWIDDVLKVSDVPNNYSSSAIEAFGLASSWSGVKVHFDNVKYEVNSYSIIQEAINEASDGDTIFVKSGTYYENVVVNKTVALIGENKNTTIIDGNGTGTVLTLTADSITLEGFTIQNSGILRWDSGIYVYSFNNNISNNMIKSNNNGVHIIGGNNILRDNSLTNNVYNLGIWGSSLSYYYQDIDTSNKINGKPIYFLVNQSSFAVPDDAGYIGIVNSWNVTVSNLDVEKNGQGILLAYSSNCLIENVNILSNRFGIHLRSSTGNVVRNNVMLDNEVGVYLYFSGNNIVEENTITGVIQGVSGIEIHLSDSNSIIGNFVQNVSSGGIGIWGSNGNEVFDNELDKNRIGIVLDSDNTMIIHNVVQGSYEGIEIQNSHYNTIYHNNFINNTIQLRFTLLYSFDDIWDNGCEGNYWSNYNGTDLDRNGIGDNYLPWEDVDYYPLMNPYWTPADIDHDLDVDIFDVVLCASAYGSTPSDPNWNPHCDITEPYRVIDIYDIVMIAGNYGKEYNP